MDVLNDEIKWFVDSYVDSLLSWDIIIFLYNNSMKASQANELAKHFDKSPKDVARTLRQLKNQGLIKCCNNNDFNQQRYKVSHNFNQKVAPFIAALNQRQQRLAILAEVLKRTYSL